MKTQNDLVKETIQKLNDLEYKMDLIRAMGLPYGKADFEALNDTFYHPEEDEL